jgi:hypothetical protein
LLFVTQLNGVGSFHPSQGEKQIMSDTITAYKKGIFCRDQSRGFRHFFLKLWSGEIPLWKSYWIYGVVVGAILRLLSPLLTYLLVSHTYMMSAFDISMITYTWTAILATYAIVISVGIWRSATKYAVSYPNRNGYATLGKICVVLGALSVPAAYVQMASNDTNSISALPKATSPDEQMQYQAS